MTYLSIKLITYSRISSRVKRMTFVGIVSNIRFNDRIWCFEGMEEDGFSSKILTYATKENLVVM